KGCKVRHLPSRLSACYDPATSTPSKNDKVVLITMKRVLKLTTIGIVVLVIVSALGMVIWATLGTRHAQDVALAALESSENVTVRQNDWIVFEPASKAETGIIFYPGGLV